MGKVDFLDKFSKLVKSERLKKGLSQTELSELSGVCRYSIVKIENGKSNTTLYKAYRIITALGISGESNT